MRRKLLYQKKEEIKELTPEQEKPKKRVASEGKFHFVKGEITESEKKRKSTRKIAAIVTVLVILGVFIWYSPTIISTVQNYFSQSSYTKLTLVRSSSPSPANFTTLTFGEIDYSFGYSRDGFLCVSNSLLEGKAYRPENGSVYKDIGIEVRVSEVHSDYIVLFVKPTLQDYLAQTGFRKLTIAQGQYQTVIFNGNEFTIAYFQKPPYNVSTLIVTTPLLLSREYYIFSSQILNCDLGLEIRIYKATSQYTIIFVKPLY